LTLTSPVLAPAPARLTYPAAVWQTIARIVAAHWVYDRADNFGFSKMTFTAGTRESRKPHLRSFAGPRSGPGWTPPRLGTCLSVRTRTSGRAQHPPVGGYARTRCWSARCWPDSPSVSYA